jgi:putative phosphoesterase
MSPRRAAQLEALGAQLEMTRLSQTHGEDETSIGVISDTHGLVRPEAIDVLKGVDLILHAGDIGTPQVLQELRIIAPVVAITGNNDTGEWMNDLPQREVVQVGAVHIFMLHDLQEIDLNPAAAGFRVVVSGHSHKPSVEERNGILYVNPGSAGPRRFTLPISVVRLTIEGPAVSGQIIELSVQRGAYA